MPYLLSLSNEDDADPAQRLVKAYERIQAHEKTLSERMLAYLLSEQAGAKGVHVVGPETAQDRVPTISFVVIEQADSSGGRVTYKKKVMSKDIVSRFDATQKVSHDTVLASEKTFDRRYASDRNQVRPLLLDKSHALSATRYERYARQLGL